MLKSKFKFLLSILLVLLLITSYCIATEEPATTENPETEEVQVTTTSEGITVTPEDVELTSNEQTGETNWISNDLFEIENTVRQYG